MNTTKYLILFRNNRKACGLAQLFTSFLLIHHYKVSKHILYSVSSEAIKKQESKPKAMYSSAPLYKLKLYKDNYELTIRNIFKRIKSHT